MSKPPLPVAAAFAVGLLAAVFLIWLARRPPAPALPVVFAGPPAAPARPAPARPAVLPPRPGDAHLDLGALLSVLAEVLARGGARPAEAVLTFRDDAALRRFLDRAASAGLAVLDRADALRTARIRFSSLEALHDALAPHLGDLAALDPNHYFALPVPPAREERPDVDAVPFRNDTLAFLGAAGDRSGWGRGVLIAVLDTGIAPDPTFGAQRLRYLDLGYGLAPAASGAHAGHGTGVAALAAGAAPDAAGVAPAAGLLSIRVTDTEGLADLFGLARAIVAATDAGARIVNISLGGHAGGAVLDAALAYARGRGALVVAAAGNDQADRLAWPAADPRVLSVGAVDRTGRQVAFSNSGEGLGLVAPGYGVQTAWLDRQRAYVDGTSAAAPLVAGALAVILAQHPALSAAQAADLLLATAGDAGPPGPDPAYGHGILDVGWALNRDNPDYVDTAVSTLAYNPAAAEVRVVLQNRSGRSVTGLALAVEAGTVASTRPLPTLAPGETYTTRIPVGDPSLRPAAGLPFSTRLVNPPGLADRVPDNNRRATVLPAR